MKAHVWLAVLLATIFGTGIFVGTIRTLAQPIAQVMGPGQQMPMGQTMMQMQQQMDQMSASLQAMRARLDRINPALLTAAEREMYEYLRVLQSHMETMQMWVGNAQGVMRQMSGPRR